MSRTSTFVVVLLAVTIGYFLGSSRPTPRAQAQGPAPEQPRYQISAFGFGYGYAKERGATENKERHGAYVLDTQTGQVWLTVDNLSGFKKIGKPN